MSLLFGRMHWRHLQTSKGTCLTVSGYAVVEGEERRDWTGERDVGSSVDIQPLNPRELARCPRENVWSTRADPRWQLLRQRFPFKELLLSSSLRVSGHTNCQQPVQSSKFPPNPPLCYTNIIIFLHAMTENYWDTLLQGPGENMQPKNETE